MEIRMDNNKWRLNRLFFILVLIQILYANIFAQLSLETNFENYYDDNIYNNSFKVEDFINSFSISNGFNFETEYNNLQLYYMGNISYYQKNIVKSSNSHKLGVVETYLFSEDDNPLNAGINFSWRNNREDFKVFDFNQLSTYVNYRQTIASGNRILLGYVFNKNNYENLDMFSHYEHKSFLKMIFTFYNRTSVALGLNYDAKAYSNTSDSSGASSNAQFGIYTNLSQSIDDYSEISGYAAYKKALKDGTRYVNANNLIFYEEEIFNDLYSNEGYELGISFSKYFSETILTKYEFTFSKKNYPNLPVPDAEGFDTAIFRKDNQFAGAVSAEFYLNSIINGLSLELTWNYIKNNSNDRYYNYDNNLLSFRFNWGL